MITSDKLLILAGELGIKVVFTDLRPAFLGKADAVKKIIFLDRSLLNNSRILKCVLAEEIGHILFPPRPGHVRYHSKGFIHTNYADRSLIKRTVAQDERKALQWATNVLMPDIKFWQAVKESNNTVYMLADYFDVEEWFAMAKIGFLRVQARESGGKIKWREIIKREQSAPTLETPHRKGVF